VQLLRQVRDQVGAEAGRGKPVAHFACCNAMDKAMRLSSEVRTSITKLRTALTIELFVASSSSVLDS
jgi:hypothetical protein